MYKATLFNYVGLSFYQSIELPRYLMFMNACIYPGDIRFCAGIALAGIHAGIRSLQIPSCFF